jgi:hypothetical protein
MRNFIVKETAQIGKGKGAIIIATAILAGL